MHTLAGNGFAVIATAFFRCTQGNAFDDPFNIDIDLESLVQRLVKAVQQVIQRYSLGHIARVTIQDKSGSGVFLVESLFDQPQHDRIGDQLTPIYHGLGLQAKLRARLSGRSKHCTGGNMG